MSFIPWHHLWEAVYDVLRGEVKWYSGNVTCIWNWYDVLIAPLSTTPTSEYQLSDCAVSIRIFGIEDKVNY